MIEEYLAHLLIGSLGAVAGWIGSSYCEHNLHRLTVTAILVLIESFLVVRWVG